MATRNFYKDQERMENDLKQQGLDKDKKYLYETAIQAEKLNKRKKKPKNESYGWDVFNSDSLYRAYDKRTKKLPGETIMNDK
jgi:hypothetical protein